MKEGAGGGEGGGVGGNFKAFSCVWLVYFLLSFGGSRDGGGFYWRTMCSGVRGTAFDSLALGGYVDIYFESLRASSWVPAACFLLPARSNSLVA